MALGALQYASAGLSGVSTLAEGMGRAAGYRASEKAYKAQARDKQATERYEQWRHQIMQRQAIGDQIATYAGLGLEIEGTAIENLAATVRELTYERVAALEASRAEVRGLYQSAEDARKAAKSAKRGGFLGGLASVVGGVAGFAVGGPAGAVIGSQIGG